MVTNISPALTQSNLSLPDYYRLDINGLRALAVAAVIANHLNSSFLPAGYLGVDLFFVISGYVITASLERSRSDNFVSFLASFYARRTKRLLPALIVCILVSSVLICLFNPWPQSDMKTGISALFGMSNIWLYLQDVRYFTGSAELSVFTQTWSLGVEEQFYLLFPWLVWFSGFGRKGRKGYKLLACLLAPLMLASLLSFLVLNRSNPSAAFYLMTSRFWELAAGCAAYLCLRSYPYLRAASKWPLNLICLLGIISILFLNVKSKEVVLIVVLTSYLLVRLNPKDIVYSFLSLPVLQWVGTISYSLYLWHWTVIVISRWTIGIRWWTIPLQLVMVFGLAIISYYCIETPFRNRVWGSVNPVLCGSCASVFSSLVLLFTGLNPSLSLFIGKRSGVLLKEQLSSTNYSLAGTQSEWIADRCILNDSTDYQKLVISPGDCSLGDFRHAKRRVLVIGNSYSVTFREAFSRLVLHDRYAIVLTSSYGSPPAPGLRFGNVFDSLSIDYWDRVVPDLVRKLRAGDLVMVLADMNDFSNPTDFVRSAKLRAQLKTGLASFADQLRSREIELVVLSGLPFARDAQCDPSVASPQWFRPNGSPCRFLSKTATLQRMKELNLLLADLEDDGKIKVLDLMPVFCPGSICTYNAANGQLLYRDSSSHPSDEAARLSAPLIRQLVLSTDQNRATP